MSGWWFFWFFIIPIIFIFFTLGSLLYRGTSYYPYWRRRRSTAYAPDVCHPVYTIQSQPAYPPGQMPPPYPYYPNATGPPPYSTTTPQYTSQPLYPMNPSKNQFY